MYFYLHKKPPIDVICRKIPIITISPLIVHIFINATQKSPFIENSHYHEKEEINSTEGALV